MQPNYPVIRELLDGYFNQDSGLDVENTSDKTPLLAIEVVGRSLRNFLNAVVYSQEGMQAVSDELARFLQEFPDNASIAKLFDDDEQRFAPGWSLEKVVGIHDVFTDLKRVIDTQLTQGK